LFIIQDIINFKLEILGFKPCNIILCRRKPDIDITDQLSAILPYLDPALNFVDIYYFCLDTEFWYKMNSNIGNFQKIDKPSNLENIDLLFEGLVIGKNTLEDIPKYLDAEIKKHKIDNVILYEQVEIKRDNFFIKPKTILKKIFLAEWPQRGPMPHSYTLKTRAYRAMNGNITLRIKDCLVLGRDLATDLAKHQINQEIGFTDFRQRMYQLSKENQYILKTAPYKRRENLKDLVVNAASSSVICAAEGGWFNFAMYFNVPLIMIIPEIFTNLQNDELKATFTYIFSKFKNKKRVSFVSTQSLMDHDFYNKFDDEIADLIFGFNGKKIITANTDDENYRMLDTIEKAYRHLFAFI
jgi:hypothetical protein